MNTRKGFTLVELLVVIAILAILATVSVVGYTSYIEGAEEKAALTEASEVHSAILTALTLNKEVVLDVNGGKVVCVRSGNEFTLRDYNSTNDADLESVTGISAEVVEKLTYTPAAGSTPASLIYAYDESADAVKYDVVANEKQ